MTRCNIVKFEVPSSNLGYVDDLVRNNLEHAKKHTPSRSVGKDKRRNS